ncbi:MAG: hypothetical protein DI555_06425 [Novosphingobium pentaromativorans]|uniref:Uncharacterized protein n=1 Tax=Novosphingobium pentaromativorans TaxID=205844 RepID=A0A2W5P0B6_9SPHN|nr:MAG: hypothetical protein DI555_06425 [Novosphingobium pentaromativorans]
MSPGAYLQKRRVAAGLEVVEVAAALVAFGRPIRPITDSDILALEHRLFAAEENDPCLTPVEASLLRRIFAFDAAVYELLFLRHFAGAGCTLPEPHICRDCGCSWLDACRTSSGPCSWTSSSSDLCTGCLTDDQVQPTRQGEFA